eukprot:scaffold1418_cov114-Isochrysis_galbana.AAC.1
MLNRCCPRQAFRSHAVPLPLMLVNAVPLMLVTPVAPTGAGVRQAGAFPMCVPYVCPAMDEQVPARPRRAAVPRVRSGPGHATRQKNDMFGWRNHDMGWKDWTPIFTSTIGLSPENPNPIPSPGLSPDPPSQHTSLPPFYRPPPPAPAPHATMVHLITTP